MQKLAALIDELESKIAHSDKLNQSVSAASVGWHLDHTLLATDKIIGGLKSSDPAAYKSGFNSKKLLVFTLKKIPRGKAKAPDSVQPSSITIDGIKTKLEAVRAKIKALPDLHPRNYIVHPVFGHLDTKNTIQFLEIHTRHHLQIINDIIKAG